VLVKFYRLLQYSLIGRLGSGGFCVPSLAKKNKNKKKKHDKKTAS
jgi:hypothetical protein